ncbi:unnamed protein product [Clonostachys solani]|uniref:EKC/KEOPS complex subunit CGI121 n=1 Tax=Clonostachys solani TaxID=160281 RepID=A0A9N9ZLL6_9HYPO|nr:unnamed protein product [Clonostachys solani]
MALETVTLDHLPASQTVHIAYFRNVRNAAFLHSQLLARNPDFEYGFVDASIIVSRLHLLSAVFRAATTASTNSLITPNVHSEIIISLSPSNNISEAYRRYGISPSTKDLLVVKVSGPNGPSHDDIAKHLSEHVEGDQLPVTDENIAPATDNSKVAKYYKLNGLSWLDAIKDQSQKRKEVETLVVGTLAVRGI